PSTSCEASLNLPDTTDSLNSLEAERMQREGRQPLMRIIEATYGSGENREEVTGQLHDHLRNGHSSLTVSNTLFGDPCPNRLKTLRLTYELSSDSQQYRHEVEEHHVLSFVSVDGRPG